MAPGPSGIRRHRQGTEGGGDVHQGVVGVPPAIGRQQGRGVRARSGGGAGAEGAGGPGQQQAPQGTAPFLEGGTQVEVVAIPGDHQPMAAPHVAGLLRHGSERLRARGHHPVTAAAHQEHPGVHAAGRALIEQQRHRRADRHHRLDAGVGKAGLVGRGEETALQHPADVALRIHHIGAEPLQQGGARTGSGQLQHRGGAIGLAHGHDGVRLQTRRQLQSARRGRVDHGGDVHGPQPQILRTGRRRLAGEHRLLLGPVAAGVAGKQHGVSVAGQVPGPAFEALGVVPEPMGDHHQVAVGTRLRLDRHHLQGPGAMAHGDGQLLAFHRQRTGATEGGADPGGRHGGQQTVGLALLTGDPIDGEDHRLQIHRGAPAGQGLQHLQQGEPALRVYARQRSRQLPAVDRLGHPLDLHHGGEQQQHLVDERRAGRLLGDGPHRQGQGRLERLQEPGGRSARRWPGRAGPDRCCRRAGSADP